MKIAIIGHKRIPSNEGGIEKGVEQHAVRMVQRGNDVTVYNRGGHNVFGKEFDGKKLKKYKGINIVTVPTVKGAACVPIYSFLATIHAAFSRYDCYPASLVLQIILISVKLNEGTDSDILMFFTAECLNQYLLVLSYQSYKNSRYLPDQSLTPAIITIQCTTTSLDREMLHQRYDNNYSTF